MSIKSFLKTTKGKVIAGASTAAVVAAVVVTVLLLKKDDTYRSIIVKEVAGTVDVVGDMNNGQAYSGQRLYGGDDVSVSDASSLTMLMDNDKYMYADANTHFKLEAEQSKNSSKIRIILYKGSELNELKSSLGPNDSYDVDSPSSTMSVRGTKFRVTVIEINGMTYVLVEVDEGTVKTRLKTTTGEYTGEERDIVAGESALIRANTEFSEFVKDENGEIIRHLDYDVLPTDGVERLIALLKEMGIEIEPDDPEPTTESTTETTTETTTEKTTDKTTETTTGTTTETSTDKTTEKTTSGTTEGSTTHTHSYGSWTITKPATCVAEGKEERTCSGCGNKESRTIAATGEHTYGAWKVTKPATCTAGGIEERVCTGCGKSESKATLAKGHDYSDWSTTLATCTKDGYRIRNCSRCGASEKETLAATGHKFGDYVTTKAATCKATGTETRTCSACKTTESRTLPALGHLYNEYKVTTAPGCETTGEETSICSRCGDKDTRTVEAKGHQWGEWFTIRAMDCQNGNPGLLGRECSACHKTEEKTVAVAHTYGEWQYSSSDCETGGERIRTCTICSHPEIEHVDKIEHVWQYSYSDFGKHIYVCQRCGKEKEGEAPDLDVHP